MWGDSKVPPQGWRLWGKQGRQSPCWRGGKGLVLVKSQSQEKDGMLIAGGCLERGHAQEKGLEESRLRAVQWEREAR